MSGTLSDTLTVATTDPADVRAIRARGADAVVVDHSLSALDAAKARLDRAAAQHAATDAPVWYVDVRTNTLTVEAISAESARSLLRAARVDTSSPGSSGPPNGRARSTTCAAATPTTSAAAAAARSASR